MQDSVTEGSGTEPPSPSSGTIGYFNRQAGGWSAKYTGSRHFAARLAIVSDWMAEKPSGSTVLDYGCGSGVMVKVLAEQRYRVTGVDVSAEMIESARRTLQENGDQKTLEQLELIQPPDYQGRYLNGRFETVISLGVLEYVEDLKSCFDRLVPLIEPGGSLILSVPNKASFLRKIEQFVHKNPAFFRLLGLFPHLTGPDSYLQFQKHQFTLKELDAFLSVYGLKRQRALFHVVPGLLKTLESCQSLAMTVIVEYRKD